ncbi:MAG: MCE family protein [Lentisphaeria bacterium]|nr:MCE family protein [Lentisphaeria bacterium]
MNQANKVKLGAFLLISATLLISGFLAVGITKLLAPKYHAMTVVNTSVEGLSVGSAVKYLGLPVGKITGMAMRESDGYIVIYFDIFPSAVESDAGSRRKSNANDLDLLMRNKKLMCFVNAAGLMGGSYLELTSTSASQPALPNLEINSRQEDDVTYIPSLPSHIGNAIQNISRMLEDLAKIDIPLLMDKINGTLDNATELLTRSNLQETLKSVHQISLNLENSISRFQSVFSEQNIGRINRMLDNGDQSMAELKRFTADAELVQTVENLNSFLTDARRVLNKAEKQGQIVGAEALELKKQLETSLIRMDNLLKQLAETAGDLSGDPAQFIRGRRSEPVLEKN